MKRYHQEKFLLTKRQKLNAKFGVMNDAGRYRKRHPLDCGKTKCYICHSNKLPKRSLHEQEIAAGVSFKEQIKEMSNGPH